MPPAPSNPHPLTARLYFLGMALSLGPALFQALLPIWHTMREGGHDYGVYALIVLLDLVLIALLVGLGLGLRAGKRWAQVLVLVYAAASCYLFIKLVAPPITPRLATLLCYVGGLLATLAAAWRAGRSLLQRRAR